MAKPPPIWTSFAVCKPCPAKTANAALLVLQRTNLFQETLSGQPFTSEANASNLKKILYSPENNKMEDEPEFDITLAMAQQALSMLRPKTLGGVPLPGREIASALSRSRRMCSRTAASPPFPEGPSPSSP